MSGQQAQIGRPGATASRSCSRGSSNFVERLPMLRVVFERAAAACTRGYCASLCRSAAAACRCRTCEAASRATCCADYDGKQRRRRCCMRSGWNARLVALRRPAGRVRHRRDDAGRRRLPAALRRGPAVLRASRRASRASFLGRLAQGAGSRLRRGRRDAVQRWKPRSTRSTSTPSGARNNPMVARQVSPGERSAAAGRSSSRCARAALNPHAPGARAQARRRTAPLPIRAGASRCRTSSRARRSMLSADARRAPGHAGRGRQSSGSARSSSSTPPRNGRVRLECNGERAGVVPSRQVAGQLHAAGRRASSIASRSS